MPPDFDDSGLRRYLLGLLARGGGRGPGSGVPRPAGGLGASARRGGRPPRRLCAGPAWSGRHARPSRAGTSPRPPCGTAWWPRARSAWRREKTPGSARLASRSAAGRSDGRVPLALAAGLALVLLAFWTRPPRPAQSTSASPPPTPATQAEAPRAPAFDADELSLRAGHDRDLGAVGDARGPGPLAGSPARGRSGPSSCRFLRKRTRSCWSWRAIRASCRRSASALEAAVETVEGKPVWRGEARRAKDARRPSLLASARVPAARLLAGDYVVTLSVRGTDDGTLHRYFFRVRP